MPDTDFSEEHLPTEAFHERDLDLVDLDQVSHFRAFETRHPDPLGFRPASSRFSDPGIREGETDVYATVYFGTSVETCVLEAIIRDSGLGTGTEGIPVSRRFLQGWSIVQVKAAEPLRLLDLRGSGTMSNRIPTDAVRAQSHDLGQIWSQAIHAHKSQPDGIIFSSRLNEQPNVAIFERSMPKIRSINSAPLFSYGSELAAILDTYQIALV
ncbi:RES family NAD+ phosphorylase [Ruegeria sp. 2012CJ41-6]|uniref:RES family NAD+ phosphorylase n=1 Tax=Ruegeria spongiae TaxID=2942209 RepID=A0ABT0Q8A2_9RHOB|nr:RES family NAD+ phosphorylase [Ruegeria spongiae]MCL6286103.1 RES family NAD+ phosphorylase [Ruegeria spongiae]